MYICVLFKKEKQQFMGINLHKELQGSKEDQLKKSTIERDSVQEVKLLLAGEDLEDQRILRHLGSNSTVMQLENFTGDNIEWEQLEKEYGQVFTIDQIEKLAIDYRLRFLNSNSFIGDMDRQVTAKIKEFSKETNTSLDEQTLRKKFYILSVPSSFSLQKVKATRFDEWKERRRLAALDPVLFYQIDETHYRLIHQWGKEFTAWRRLLGYRWRNQNTFRTTTFFFLLPILAMGIGIVFPGAIWLHPFLTSFLLLVVAGLFAWIGNLYVLKEGGTFSEDTTKYQDKFFTPNNWNSTVELQG